MGTLPPTRGRETNVLFFDKGRPTDEVWIYDQRTNVAKITKGSPLTAAAFEGFEASYAARPRHESERFHCFSRKEIAERDDNLDIFWLRDDSLDDPDDLPEPEDLVAEAVTQLETALDALNELAVQLGMNDGDGAVTE